MDDDFRSLGDLAKEALEMMNENNISVIAHSFSYAMSRLRAISIEQRWENDIELNQHYLSVLYADRIGYLTRRSIDGRIYNQAKKWAEEEVKKLPIDTRPELKGGFAPEEDGE